MSGEITYKEMLGIYQRRIIELEAFNIPEDEISKITDQKRRSITRITKQTLDLNKGLLAFFGEMPKKYS